MIKKHNPKRWFTGSVMMAAATVGLVVGFAGPASADPASTYVAVGSDTTQDVMDAFATSIGGGTLGSWDAVNPGDPANPHDTINPKAGCSMTRPNGSGEGLSALRKSINPSTGAAQLANAPEANCVDIARSSSGPGANQANNGDLVYIPFALDAVTMGTGPATAVTGTSDDAVATHITNADSFTVAELTSLYHDCLPTTVGSVTYDPNATLTTPPAPGDQAIHLYIPQQGSGTRNFWAATLGNFNNTNLPTCVHDHSVLTPSEQVQEHDGTIFAQDPDGVGPFSIAQFIAQGNGHNDRRHHVAIHSLNGIAPLTGTSLNTGFPITREIYNIVKTSRVTAGSADFNAGLAGILVGTTSKVCAGTLTIRNFGFAPLTGAPLGHTCGQVATNLRAFAPGNV